MKRAKRIVIIILILSLTIFGVVKSAISVSDSDFDQYSDFAETGGSKETALKKILSAPLASCIGETFGWNDKFWSMTTLNFNSSDVQGGQWFADFWSTTGSGNTDVVKLRKFVIKLGYKITREELVMDNDIIYTVIEFNKGNEKYNYDQIYFGPRILENKNELFYEYYSKKLLKYENLLLQLPGYEIFSIMHHKHLIKIIRRALTDVKQAEDKN